MALSSTALCTLQDVADHALQSDTSLRDLVFASGAQYEAEAGRIIEAASDRIRQFLGRDLIAREYTDLLSQEEDWTRSKRAPSGADLRLDPRIVRSWPVLSVDEAVTVVDERTIYAGQGLDSITYIAGYRRADQVLADLPQAVQDAIASDADVPTLPAEIVRCAAVLSVIRATHQLQGLEGVSTATFDQGDFATTVTKNRIDTEAEMRALRQIQRHRRFT